LNENMRFKGGPKDKSYKKKVFNKDSNNKDDRASRLLAKMRRTTVLYPTT
jgi:hypothetical protein